MLNRFRTMYVSLQTSIAAIFTLIVIMLGLVIFFLSYYTFDDLVMGISNQTLTNSTKTVNLKLTNFLSPYKNFSKITKNIGKTKLLELDDKEKLRRYFLGILESNPSIYSIYIAKPNGSFFQVKKNISDPNVFIEEDFNRDANPAVRTQSIMDDKGNLLDQQVIEDMKYDPRIKNWYVSAKDHEDPVWSSIYKFAIKQDKDVYGLTHSRSIFEDSEQKFVLGIDVETYDLTDFIDKQKIYDSSEIFLIDKDGKLISSSKAKSDNAKEENEELFEDPKVLISFLNYTMEGQPVQLSTFEGEDYLAAYHPVEGLEGADWVVGHIVNYDEVTEPLRRLLFWYWSLMIGSILISILIAVYLSGKISKPINTLAKSAKDLERLELDKSVFPESRIREIRRLSKAFKSMNVALSSFIKYMPTTLVKRLLKQDEIAQTGGSSRVLPVMFLDFKNFTKVSEKMSPDILLEYLSGYLESMTHVIHQYGGTVDKYIGDSIMAFWGAPGTNRYVHSNTVKACECALAMHDELQEYNKKMQEKDLPILEMRIGLHVGDITVGNLGSSDKLNYTVIGDNVNLASRLESLCKYYGVGTIVSDDVVTLAGEYLCFRLLDIVKVKGKSISIKVFELVKEPKYEEKDQSTFKQAFKLFQEGEWEQSLEKFKELAVAYPDDNLITLHIERMEEKGGQPPPNWDGAWMMETK